MLLGGRSADFSGAGSQRFRINLSWLLKLRWLAVGGQLATIVGARVLLGLEMPFERLLPLVAIGAITNAAVQLWSIHRRDRLPAGGEWIIGGLMVLDILLLSGLLFVSGGTANPFSIFYLVNIALASMLLAPRWGWLLNGLAIACFVTLFFFHLPFPGLRDPAPRWLEREAPTDMTSVGMLAAVAAAATILVYFMTRVKGELAQREEELARERQRKAQIDKFEALATLAAGAAHELATPLSTIAVISRELEIELARKGPLENAVEDARLVRREVDRCRAILDQMSFDAGESVGEEMSRTRVKDLWKRALAPLAGDRRVDFELAEEAAEIELTIPVRALARALRGIVRNALDASDTRGRVQVSTGLEGDTLVVTVRDRGEGMSPETLARAAEPFFTSKEPGRGLGLGLFLARSVFDRLGGDLRLRSTRGEGTTVIAHLPVSRDAAGTGFASLERT